MGSTIKHAALSYARKGWKVFPISPNLKTPLAALAPQGHKNATSDQTTIEQWWSAYPNANIGLNLEASGLVCVDVDSYKEDCGFNDFMVGREMPATLRQKSARGGTHYIFRASKGASYPGKLCSGVDIKYKGYILVAPSRFDGGVTDQIGDFRFFV